MKKLITLILLAFAGFTANAHETLFSNNFQLNCYLGADIKFTNNLNADLSVLLGGKVVFFIYDQFGMGFGTWHTVSSNDFTHDALPIDRDFDIDFGYSGIHFDYIYNHYDLIHVNLNCIVGIGKTYVTTEYLDDCNTSYTKQYGHEYFGIIEPGFEFELNVFSWMKLALGGSYRYIYEFDDFYGYKKSDMEGISGVLTFRISSKY